MLYRTVHNKFQIYIPIFKKIFIKKHIQTINILNIRFECHLCIATKEKYLFNK